MKLASGNEFLHRSSEVLRDQKDRPAILAPGGKVLRTFRDLDETADRWADRLHAAGLARRTLLLALPNHPAWPEIFLGALRADVVPVPCEPEATTEARALLARIFGAAAVVRTNHGGTLFESVGDASPVPGGLHLLKLSSGTTSGRRAIGFSGDQLATDARNVSASMGIRTRDRNLAAIPFAHSYGLTNLIGCLLCVGSPVVLASDPMPAALLAAAEEGGATVFPGVPAHFRSLAGTGRRCLPQSLRLCISAGAPLPVADGAAFFNATGRKVHAFYGASECGGICYDRSEEPISEEGFVGPPIEGVTVSPHGIPGDLRIEVSGPAVGTCYLPTTTDGSLGSGRFLPSDIVECVPAGCIIRGRRSDLILIGARKIHPGAVERVLQTIPGVGQVVVFAGPGVGGSETVAACFVGTVTSEALRAHAARLLPAWEVPKHCFQVSRIETDPRGKISRTGLRARFFQAS